MPYLERLGQGVTYVGAGELARIVKICHNVFLGVVIQTLVEITMLAEKSGVTRHAFLDFINKSVMGSMFTRYKSPALVNLDFTPTFTPVLLRKDLELGLAAGKKTDTPMPLTALTREIIQSLDRPRLHRAGFRDAPDAAGAQCRPRGEVRERAGERRPLRERQRTRPPGG